MSEENDIKKARRDLMRKFYESACNDYANAFCEKHGYYKLGEGSDTYWVGNSVGGVLMCGDEFADLTTIMTDINEDAPEEEFMRWNDYYMLYTEVFDNERDRCMTFRNWLHGAPRIPYDTLNHLRLMKERFKKAVKDAKKEGGLA